MAKAITKTAAKKTTATKAAAKSAARKAPAAKKVPVGFFAGPKAVPAKRADVLKAQAEADKIIAANVRKYKALLRDILKKREIKVHQFDVETFDGKKATTVYSFYFSSFVKVGTERSLLECEFQFADNKIVAVDYRGPQFDVSFDLYPAIAEVNSRTRGAALEAFGKDIHRADANATSIIENLIEQQQAIKNTNENVMLSLNQFVIEAK